MEDATKPAFDREAAMERVGDDTEFLKELVEMFNSESPQQLAEISKAISELDFKTIRETAHSIKSASGNLGLTRVYDLSFQIEKMGRDETIQGIEGLYKELDEELKRSKNLF